MNPSSAGYLQVHPWLAWVAHWASVPLFQLGTKPFTAGEAIYIPLAIVITVIGAHRFRLWLVHKALTRAPLERGAREALASMLYYAFLGGGLLVIADTAGLDITTLHVYLGALLVGVGLGLQNMATNFVSGLVILLERPISVGDRVDIGHVNGEVVHIGARSTRVVTNDNITYVVPNSSFMNDNVVNLTTGDPSVRFHVPVTVAYGSDLSQIKKLLLEVAGTCPDALAEPEPRVLLTNFGDAGLDLELRVWTRTLVGRPGRFKGQINEEIYRVFTLHGIEFPAPQRELSGRLELKPSQA